MPGNREVFSAAIDAAERHRWHSRWLEAGQEYQRAIAEFPDDATARSGLGFCFMQMKQWQQALGEYEYVFQRDPGNIIALSKIAELYGILNRREDAYSAYLRLADLYSQAGQGARAEAAWQKAVQLSPGKPVPHERLATYYFEKKDIAAMIQQRLAAAEAYLLHNEPDAARAQCEEVLRADSANRQALQLLVQIQKRMESTGGPVGNTGSLRDIPAVDISSGPSVNRDHSTDNSVITGNISGGNTGIMGNMGSAGNFGGTGNQGPAPTMAGAGGMNPAPHRRITASQVTEVLKQAQIYQEQQRYNDAINLCEQILESGFDRPDARYFLGWLYQEQQRWDEAIRQFQHLLNDPDYALSCYYALGQCYRARGDLRSATIHFDEAVDRVNLDALTMEESDQLVQLCQEAAEAHRMLGEQEQALTVYNALLGFLRSRGWSDKVAQVEFLLQQAQQAPAQPFTPPTGAGSSQILTGSAEDSTMAMPQQSINSHQVPPAPQASSQSQVPVEDAATMAFNSATMQPAGPQQPPQPVPPTASSAGSLPDWLTGILSESDQTQAVSTPKPPANQAAPAGSQPDTNHAGSPAPQQPQGNQRVSSQPLPSAPQPPPPPPAQAAIPDWLAEDAKPARPQPQMTSDPQMQAMPPGLEPTVKASPQSASAPHTAVPPVPPAQQSPVLPVPSAPLSPPPPARAPADESYLTMLSAPSAELPAAPARPNLEELLGQIAGSSNQLNQVAEPLLTSTAHLPENIRPQVVRSMQDIQKYINHGLLTPAMEECLRVIDMAPQYLDVHQVLCEIYVRQGKIDQAITKYGILVDTYLANRRIDDAIATYRRILQLDPNNLTYRLGLIKLLSSQGNKEDLLRERTLVAESYLRLGYMDRALTELEQALQESPTNVPTRLNYALALQKLGRMPQAIAEYQRVLQVDPRNITALVRWHIAMITTTGGSRSTALEVLTRIRWQLRGEGQKHASMVLREYQQARDLYPNNADVHFSIGQIYHQMGQFDKAVDEYLLAMRDSEVEVIARASAAQCLLVQGRPSEAIHQLEQATQTVQRDPSAVDPATWAARPREEGEEHKAPGVELSVQLADAYRRTGRYEQADQLMLKVKQKRPALDEVASAMAEISARKGDLEGAMQEYLDLVRHYRNSRQIDNALNVLNEMVRLAPQDARAHSELADIYINRGLLDEGIAELRLLADIYLRNNDLGQASSVLQRIGNLYSTMGDDDEALANLCRAAELTPNDLDLLRDVVGLCMRIGHPQQAAHYQEIIARHYFETQQVKESVAALQQLIAIDRNNFEAYDMLGQTYQSVGEYEQASRVYRNLAKVNPGSSVARERLATLQELRSR
ncbi:MAG: tetratricopeptide repeat protein [Ktedonobacteraceae bacterium]|nr:tetratricopeptide repeat protein [Ktedonobacteraceae bacterium]